MTERLDVLDQIQSDLRTNLHSGNDYNHTPAEIKRGIHKWDDFIVKPVVCYTMTGDRPDTENEYGEDARWMSFMFYIYSQTDGNGGTDQIFEMLEDLETFFQSTTHFTYSNQTLIGDIEIKEGGSSDPINTAIIQIQILYES
jgi:hypothetical protein